MNLPGFPQVKAKAREEREAMTARLEAEVDALEQSHKVALEEMKAELQAEHDADMAHLKVPQNVHAILPIVSR